MVKASDLAGGRKVKTEMPMSPMERKKDEDEKSGAFARESTKETLRRHRDWQHRKTLEAAEFLKSPKKAQHEVTSTRDQAHRLMDSFEYEEGRGKARQNQHLRDAADMKHEQASRLAKAGTAAFAHKPVDAEE